MSGGLMMNKHYTSLYTFSVVIDNDGKPVTLSNDEIVSIAFVNEFDNALFPIIRMRLYVDIDLLSYINEHPNDLTISMSMAGMISMINTENDQVTYNDISVITNSLTQNMVSLNGYIETKNNPYSKYDNYQFGLPRGDSLNNNNKIPITIYCYDGNLIRATKQSVNSIYKNTTLYSVVTNMFTQCGINMYSITPFDNNKIYDQILIPNMSLIDAITYLDSYYGLYREGASMYSPAPGVLQLTRTANELYDNVYSIKVSSYTAGNSFSGIYSLPNGNTNPILQTPDTSVIVKSETDLVESTNSNTYTAMNLNNFESQTVQLEHDKSNMDITTPMFKHKTKNEFIPDMYRERLNERHTKIDVSIDGFPFKSCNPSDRFKFIFDNPIRGLNINRMYRPMVVNHVFTNIGSGRFEIQSTLQLC